MKVSPHTHIESPLTGSTLSNMIAKAKELGRTHIAYSDHGHLSSALKAYAQTKKAGLKFIPGIEIYFKDSNCPFTTGNVASRAKYFTATLYCSDQSSYQDLVRMVSRTDFPTMEINEETQQLWNWEKLEEVAKSPGISIVLGGPHCVVGKAMLAGRADAGMGILENLVTIFGAPRVAVAMLCEPWSKQYASVVEIKYRDGTKDAILAGDLVTTNRARNIKASDLLEVGGHFLLKSKLVNKTFYEVNKEIESTDIHKGFLPLPGGDITLKVNKFLKALATRFNLMVLASDYAYYANKEDKMVQTMRLEGTNKLQPNLFMKNEQEISQYLTEILECTPEIAQIIVKNNEEWAKQFDNFTLKYDWRLAEVEGSAMQKIMEIINQNGRMKWDDPKYVARLKEEIEVIHKNGIYDLSPYFLPIRDVLNHYLEQGQLTGPGRGSAGGSLMVYLMGITHIDPFKYDLPFQRFFSMVRIQGKKLPDIDVDLESRDLLVGEDGKSGYLYGRWGNKAAQISTRTTIRLKSAILDTNRYMNGSVEDSIAVLTKGFPAPPQGVKDLDFVFGFEDDEETHHPGLIELSEDLQKYAKERPKEWEIAQKAMGLTRAFSRHACFAKGTLVDSNGKVATIEKSTHSTNKPITTWSSGIKETIIVSLNNGISIRCTPDHKFISNGKEVEAKDLLGKELHYKSFSNVSGTVSIDKELAFALGWGLNDGSFNESRSNQSLFFTPGKDDAPKTRILTYLNKIGVKNWTNKSRPDEISLGSVNLPKSFFFSKTNSIQRLPEYFWELDLESQRTFMTGFFSANGYVLTTRPLIAFKIVSKLLASDVASWLLGLGIMTSSSHSKPTTSIIRNSVVNTKTTVAVSITYWDSKVKFAELVGFEQEYKAVRLSEMLKMRSGKDHHNADNRVIKCNYIDKSELTEVYDFNEPLENVGHINGVLVHNCAFVISDVPIKDVIPTKEGNVTQYEAKEVESAGLIKYDYLVVKQLKDIRIAMDLIKRKHGRTDMPVTHFPHEGQDVFVWDMPEMPEVFKSIWTGQTETMFQINTPSMRPHVINMLPENMMDLATLLALVRPGPLDFIDENTGRNMVEEYMLRRRGVATPDIQELADLLPETYGILAFQEQLGKIARDLAGMSGEDAELLRENMAKKKMEALMKMKPVFMEGAITKVSQEVAEGIWDRMVTFGRYGFSIIHAVEYAHITYACMFLKHFYPLEWWAAILTNAKEQEITGKFWPFVKDMVAAPDINLSSDEMVVDYANEKLRAKFGVLRGMGEKSIDPLVENRPYANIQDFVNKKVAGSSLAHKLIHVGVLDSLFPPKTSLLEKLKMYEDAAEVKSFQEKLAKAILAKKKLRSTQPKEGVIPEAYINIHPMQDAAMKKAVLPTMPINLYDLGSKYSKVLAPYVHKPMVFSSKGFQTILVNGEMLQRLDEMDGTSIQDDIYIAATCFVVKAEEFSYAKNTKRALKLILDSDGYVSEKVLWPEYESGKLVYPADLKKGAIATFFLKKRAGNAKKDLSITGITVETSDKKLENSENKALTSEPRNSSV